MQVSIRNPYLNNQKQNSQNFGMSKPVCTQAKTAAMNKVKTLIEKMSNLHIEENQLVRFSESELNLIHETAPLMNASARKDEVTLYLRAQEDGTLDRKNMDPPAPPSKLRGFLTSIASFPWRHKVLSAISALAISPNLYNYQMAKSSEKLNAAIIEKHGLTEVLEKCKTNPDAFYHSAKTKSTRDPDDVKRCPRLIVDRLAAKKAGKEISRLRSNDAQNGNPYRYGYELGSFMGKEYEAALKEVREGNSEQSRFIFLYHNDEFEQVIKDEDRAWDPGISLRIYRGEDIDKVVDSEMVLDL